MLSGEIAPNLGHIVGRAALDDVLDYFAGTRSTVISRNRPQGTDDGHQTQYWTNSADLFGKVRDCFADDRRKLDELTDS